MIRRVIVVLAVFLVCGVVFAHEVRANPENYLIRTFRIEVAVESLDVALPRIRQLPGIDLHSELNIQAGNGRMERLVANHELEATVNMLRSMGLVSGTSSQARNEFSQLRGLQSEFRIRDVEYRRLNDLLHMAETLVDFRIIESRLVSAISELEMLRGRINYLQSEIGTTRIHITLTTIPPETEYIPTPEPEPEPQSEPEPEPGTIQRIGNAFSRSAEATFGLVGGILILFAYTSIPLVATLIIAWFVWRLVRKHKRKAAAKSNSAKDNKMKGGAENEEE